MMQLETRSRFIKKRLSSQLIQFHRLAINWSNENVSCEKQILSVLWADSYENRYERLLLKMLAR